METVRDHGPLPYPVTDDERAQYNYVLSTLRSSADTDIKIALARYPKAVQRIRDAQLWADAWRTILIEKGVLK